MKPQGSTQLPRFVVGALATAGASAASGATVQISFANNVVSSWTRLSSFTADLTGDGTADVTAAFTPPDYNVGAASLRVAGGGGLLGSVLSMSYRWGAGGLVRVVLLSGPVLSDNISASARGLVRITFHDGRINGGTAASGWLDLSAWADFRSRYFGMRIHRLIFDDASTNAPIGVAHTDAAYSEWQVSPVPESGSNLALLALGAGGLTLRRRLKHAA